MLLESWSELKIKLQKLTYLNQYKTLIKDAVEVYLNQSSSFLSEYSHPNINFQIIREYSNIEQISRPTSPEPNDPHNCSSEWSDYYQLVSYFNQKKKNEQIVEECKELLSKLEEN